MCKDEKYLRVNEMTEPLNALEMLKEFLTQSKNNDYYLKWTIIAAHNALQGFMVLALKGTSSLPVLKWKSAYKEKTSYEILTYEATDPEDKKRAPQLDGFNDLFIKFKKNTNPQIQEFLGHNEKIINSISKFNDLRNRFIHYLPCSWSLSIPLIYKKLSDVMTVITFLTYECSEVDREYICHDPMQGLDYVKEVVDECNQLIKNHCASTCWN